ncbi:DUF1998 domain-containing protein [Arsukibacterium sp. MJ3]|uniref:DUF1998 domain-containing protein n=1 Tax=Arsukibacterium sp. MJ3 TaxID=1632859 RepID=UPI001379260D|nr:DUF1998 domain-containing protein [Arsukibacterium sp. MJ3]
MLDATTPPKLLAADKEHRPIGGATGSHKEKSCSGRNVKTNLYLGYHTQTDVLELALRDPVSGEWLSDSSEYQIVARTLAVALRDTIAEHIGIASTEMGFAVRLDKDLASKKTRSIIQVFDNVSGGAGFVLSGLNNIQLLLMQAFQLLRCPADCANACSKCLASSDSRVEQQQLDRKLALAWLANCKIEEYLHLPEQFQRIDGAELCAVGPIRFIQACQTRRKSNEQPFTLRCYLQGPVEHWDLALPGFKDRLLTWKLIDKLNIELVIPKQTELDIEMQRQLSAYRSMGIPTYTVSEDAIKVSQNNFIGVQVLFNDSCISVITNSEDATIAGENWLITAEDTIWVSSEKLAPALISPFEVDSSKLVNDSFAILELTEQLNGTISGFAARLNELLQVKAPDFATRLSTTAVKQLTYSDRYLKSPWAALLCSKLLSAFISDNNVKVLINTVSSNSVQQGKFITHDWRFDTEQQHILHNLIKNACATAEVTVNTVSSAWELPHSRILTVDWADNSQTQFLLDQGVGYWKPNFTPSILKEHDFYLDAEGQLEDILGKLEDLTVINSANWSTYFVIKK